MRNHTWRANLIYHCVSEYFKEICKFERIAPVNHKLISVFSNAQRNTAATAYTVLSRLMYQVAFMHLSHEKCST